MGLKKVLVVAASLMFVLAGGGLTYVALASGPPQARAGSPDQPPGREADVERVRAEAKSVLERALRCIPSVEDLTMRVWITCEIARVQARGGLGETLGETLKRAVQAADETEHDHRLIDVAECQAEVGHVKEALETVGRIRHIFSQKDALVRIAAAQAKAGDLGEALRTSATIRDDSYRGQALRPIAVAQAEGGDLEGALATAATIASDADRAGALVAIAARQSRAEDPAATRTLKQAQEAADKIPIFYGTNREPSDLKPNVLAEIAGALASIGATEDARKVARSITKAPWHDIAWKNIAAAQADRGETQAALETAGRIGGESEKGEALKEIVVALVRANDLATARKMADGIESRLWRSFALLEVAKGHSHADSRQAAVEIFGEVRREADHLEDDAEHGNVQPAVLGRLARTQAEAGEEQAALAWIDGQPSPEIKAWSLLGLAEGLVERLPANPRPKPAPAPKAPARVEDGPRGEAEAGEPGSPPAKSPTVRGEGPGRDAIDSFRGKVVLFGSQRYDNLDIVRIEAIHPDGTGLETLLVMDKGEAIESGRVSPDGKRMAVTVKGDATDRREVWVFGIGGMRRKIADGVDVAWSPDGTRLACIRGKMGDWESLIVDVETGRGQRLPIPKTDVVGDWSPDGQRLAVVAGNVDKVFEHPTKGTYPLRQIYLVKPDGSGREALTTGAMLDSTSARFSPDGKQVVYDERRHQEGRVLSFAVVQGRDRGVPRDLVPFHELYRGNKDFRPHDSPAWSPDGASVAWLVPRKRLLDGNTRMELVVISVSTGKVDRIDLDQKGLAWVQAIDWR